MRTPVMRGRLNYVRKVWVGRVELKVRIEGWAPTAQAGSAAAELLNQTEIAGMSHRFYAYAPVYLR